MGVTYENGKYRARVSVGGNKRRSLGRFSTKLEAQKAITQYRKELEAEDQLQKQIDDPNDHSTLLEQYAAAHPISVEVEEKPSLWARIKSIWQSTKHRS